MNHDLNLTLSDPTVARVTSCWFDWLLTHFFLPSTDSIEHVTFSSSKLTLVTMDRVPGEADLTCDTFASVEAIGNHHHLSDTSLRSDLFLRLIDLILPPTLSLTLSFF